MNKQNNTYQDKYNREELILNKSIGNYLTEKIFGWKKYIRNLNQVLQKLNEQTIISVGIVPYTRVPLSLILKNHIIYCAKYCKDVRLLRNYTRVACFEEYYPKIVSKVRGVGYLLKNFGFQNYLKRINGSYMLLFYNTTPLIYNSIIENQIPFIGNDPHKQERVLSKFEFRKLIKELGLPHLNNIQLSRKEFLNKSFADFYQNYNSSFVCQRGDLDCGGEVATFFIHNEGDFKNVQSVFSKDERFNIVEINPFITGDAISMIGCTTEHGTITGPLQTQLIDIKESIRDFTGRGVFVGHDWGLRDWDENTENTAEYIVRTIGDYLFDKVGYRGIFGIDLMHDKKNNKIFPLECNPRFTGAFPMISLLSLMHGLPPFDLLHLLQHTEAKADIDHDRLKKDFKFKSNFSHILITAKGINTMPVDMPIGIYSYNETGDEICFEREALFPWELKKKNEFLVIDSIFEKGSDIGQGASRLFKLIFPVSIAENSFKLKPLYSKIVKAFSDLLYDNIEAIVTDNKNPDSYKEEVID